MIKEIEIKQDMKEANQKLQHEMSSVHQTLNSEARVLERWLKHYAIQYPELWETVDVIKSACDRSRQVLMQHYKETGMPIQIKEQEV